MTFPEDGVLVGDIGGTNIRFAVSDGQGGFEHAVAWKADDFTNFDRALTALATHLGGLPRRAAIAVAAPVYGGPVRFTNRDWVIDPAQVAASFNFSSFEILNDTAAIALGTTVLAGDDAEQIGGGPSHVAVPGAARVVVVPGTGLGVAVAIPDGDRWRALATEGGHIALASETPDGDAVVARLREWFGRASAERALSGPGIANIYEALRTGEGAPEDAIMVSPESVTARLDKRLGDPVAAQTVALFTDFLGAFCGDMVLAHDARAGVYLTGGAFEALSAHMDMDRLRRAFEAKGRFTDTLRTVPLFRVRHACPAFAGLDVHLRAQE